LKKETEFLGPIVGPNGAMPNPEKVKTINKFPIPKTQKEIKSFLGLCGYYRKFIPNFVDISKPLTECLKTGFKVTFKDDTFIAAFNKLKQLIINDPILICPDFGKRCFSNVPL